MDRLGNSNTRHRLIKVVFCLILLEASMFSCEDDTIPYSLNLDSRDNGFEGADLLLSLHHRGVCEVGLSTNTLFMLSISQLEK